MAFSPQSTRTLDKLTPIAPQQTLLQQQLQQSITTVLPPSTAQPNNINNNSALDNCKLSTTFNWYIKDFQHFYRNPTHCQTVWSDAFYSPSSSPTTVNITNNNNDNDSNMMVLDVPNNASNDNLTNIDATNSSSFT